MCLETVEMPMNDGSGFSADEGPEEEPVEQQPMKRLKTYRWLAVIVALAVVVALVVVLRPSNDDGSGISEEASDTATTSAPEPSVDPSSDSDGDGLTDVEESNGWEVTGGRIYKTDPHNPDTDADGLSDGEEAGPLVEKADSDPVYSGMSDPTKKDSDDDGLDDFEEIRGWVTTRGFTFVTDPMQADTDGDGLSDGLEAGALEKDEDTARTYAGYSDPLQIDTDKDGVEDGEEANNGTDPYVRDTDEDGLTDLEEITRWGTDPTSADTDGDGFDDHREVQNRQTAGLDPLFHDEVISKWDYAWDFVAGALAGDAAPRDSIAWLAGNLAIGSAGLLPTIGWVIGGAADIRDAVVAFIERDWVGVSVSIMGLIPVLGDTAAVSTKLARFVDKFPQQAPAAAKLVMDLPKVSEKRKIDASKVVWGDSWDNLRKLGADDAGLLRLQSSGRINLKVLDEARNRPGYVKGKPAPFMADGRAGEDHMVKSLTRPFSKPETQKIMMVDGCIDVCNRTVRRFDALVGGVAHESKVGYRYLDDFTRRQIHTDGHLIKNGSIKGAHWHFYPSDITSQMGPSAQVLDLLDEHGIKYTIHHPKVG